MNHRDAETQSEPTHLSVRLMDLVRYQRAELHQAGLITDEEYAALAAIPQSPERLMDYATVEKDRAKLRKQVASLAAVLRKHHEHHQEECLVYFEQDGKPIEICTDLGEAYAESGLAEETTSALRLCGNPSDHKLTGN